MKVLAIDPANIESGWCLIDSTTYRPIEFGKTKNGDLETKLLTITKDLPSVCIIEMVKSYGMAVGQTVFDTCVQIGRFQRICEQRDITWENVGRKQYIIDLLGDPRAKDANVIQYLIDRFAPNTPNKGKGSKKEQGWFYGFAADVWQAYAIGVWYCDKINKRVW